jgi:hypothetical protein
LHGRFFAFPLPARPSVAAWDCKGHARLNCREDNRDKGVAVVIHSAGSTLCINELSLNDLLSIRSRTLRLTRVFNPFGFRQSAQFQRRFAMRFAMPGWRLACLALVWCTALRAEPSSPPGGNIPSTDAPPAAASPQGDETKLKAEARQSIDLDDVPEPFQPERPATPADRARTEAVSLFAAGRMKEQHEDYAGALRSESRGA